MQARLGDDPEVRRCWTNALPDANLTRVRSLSGDAFVAVIAAASGFGQGMSVPEISPGYGRALASELSQRVPFARHLEVEIFPTNVRTLTLRFPEPCVRFVLWDAAAVALDGPFDTIISSLVFKHLFPTVERALR